MHYCNKCAKKESLPPAGSRLYRKFIGDATREIAECSLCFCEDVCSPAGEGDALKIVSRIKHIHIAIAGAVMDDASYGAMAGTFAKSTGRVREIVMRACHKAMGVNNLYDEPFPRSLDDLRLHKNEILEALPNI